MRPAELAEHITRARYNTNVDGVAKWWLSGFWLGVSTNFLGVYPQVGVQIQNRKDSVYMPDKDSENRIDDLIATTKFEKKLEWNFLQNINSLNARFSLTDPKEQLTPHSREVAWFGTQDFVKIPTAILWSKLDVRVSPSIMNGSWVSFKKAWDAFEIPADYPLKIVDVVENNRTRHVMIIGDVQWQLALPLTPETTAANDDATFINRLNAIEKAYAGERIVKIQNSMANFLKTKDRNMPFVVNDAKTIDVRLDAEKKAILQYAFPLKPDAELSSPLPAGVTQEWNILVIDAKTQFTTTRDATKKEYRITTKPSESWIVFGYGTEVTTITPEEVKVNPELMNVSWALESFLRSTDGSTMLLKLRNNEWDKETTKKKYYEQIKTWKYSDAYTTLKPFVEKTSVASLFTWVTDREAKRADLYAIYGALSRVRMTEYKHLNEQWEKVTLVETLFTALTKHRTYKFSKLSEPQKALIKETVISWVMDPLKKPQIEEALKILSPIKPKFDGRWDKKYYDRIFTKKDDPMMKLIGLLAPVSDVFATRRNATAERLKNENGASWLMSLYDQVQNALNTKTNIYSEHDRLTNHVGLVFWYEANQPKLGIIEKFVFHPHMTGWAQEIPADKREEAQNYFLENYFTQNQKDVQDEVNTLITQMTEKLSTLEGLTKEEKTKRIEALKAELLSNGSVNKQAYFTYQKNGTIKSLDGLITGSVDRKIGAYSDCINFMIAKGQPSIQLKSSKTIVTPSTPIIEAFTYEPIRVSGPVVLAETIVSNQADRRANTYSVGAVGGVLKDQTKVVESTTTPVEISKEDFEKMWDTVWIWIVKYQWKDVDWYLGEYGWKKWMVYANDVAKTRKFHEWTISNWVFVPAINSVVIDLADATYWWRHLDIISKAWYLLLMQTKIQWKPYDAYKKQIEAFKKLPPEKQQEEMKKIETTTQ
jgi:hypothetical protein